MSGTVYSQRFCAAIATNTATVLYTVPAGFVAVVRCMTIGYSTGATGQGTLTVQLGASNSRIYVKDLAANQLGADQVDMYLVLPPGEVIRLSFTGTSTPYFTASGYLLTLP